MADQYPQLPMDPVIFYPYPNAEQLLPSCSKCSGMDENCEHDGLIAPDFQWSPNLGPIEPSPLQSQVYADYLTELDVLAQPSINHGPDSFDGIIPAVEQSFDDLPLSAERDFVANNIANTYTPGDRITPAPLDGLREHSASTPASCHPTEDSLHQLILQVDPNGEPVPGLKKKPTYAEVVSAPSRLHPNTALNKQKTFKLPLRLGSVERVDGPSRCLDTQSTTSTQRSNKRKRSSPQFAQHNPTRPGVQCEQCGMIYTTNAQLNHHVKNHQEDKDRPVKCHVCGKGFLWQKDLNRHSTKHTKRKDFVCAVRVNGEACGMKYTRRDNLLRHHQNTHPNIPPPSSTGSSQFT